ncbi:hypothetical protein [Lentibacillus salinarum]
MKHFRLLVIVLIDVRLFYLSFTTRLEIDNPSPDHNVQSNSVYYSII